MFTASDMKFFRARGDRPMEPSVHMKVAARVLVTAGWLLVAGTTALLGGLRAMNVPEGG